MIQQDAFGFGQFVQERRKRPEITLRGFAEQLDVAPAYMSDIEKGEPLRPDGKIEEIADLLHLT